MRNVAFIVVLTLGLGFCASSFGQEKKDLWSSVDTHMSLYGSRDRYAEFSYMLGYNFTDRFSAGVNIEGALALFKEDGVKDHYLNSTVGARLGYDIVKKLVGVSVGAGVTCSGQPYKYVYYDALLSFKYDIGKVLPTLGLGMRYYDSTSGGFDNHLRAYVSFGVILIM